MCYFWFWFTYDHYLLFFTWLFTSWMLTEEHKLYKTYSMLFSLVTLFSFINDIEAHVLCQGITWSKSYYLYKETCYSKYFDNLPRLNISSRWIFLFIKFKRLVAANNQVSSQYSSDSVSYNRKKHNVHDL